MVQYERDCNAKSIAMIESVPSGERARVQKAIDKMAHRCCQASLAAPRVTGKRRPLRSRKEPRSRPVLLGPDTEAAWVGYLDQLRPGAGPHLQWEAADGKHRWDIEEC